MDKAILLETYYTIFLFLQLAHSIEEITTGFHTKFPPLKMSKWFFITFEVTFFLFWLAVLLVKDFPPRAYLMAFFTTLMFANGVWHVVWFWFFERCKKYVPGLITAPMFIIVFLTFFYSLLFRG